MPNWNYNRMTFEASTEEGKKQLHTLVDKHIKFTDKKEPYIENVSIIPFPEGIAKVQKMYEHWDSITGEMSEAEHQAHELEYKKIQELEEQNRKLYNGCGNTYEFGWTVWGSKWGFCDCHFDDCGATSSIEDVHKLIDNDGGFTIYAEAAWNTPMGLIHKLLELYPDIIFTNEWGEEQVTEYYGIMEYDKEHGFTERTPKGQELWDILYALLLVDEESPEDSEIWYIKDDGTIGYKEDIE